LLTGLVVEKIEEGAVLPPTLLLLLSSWLHSALFWGPLGPPNSWDSHPDIFGDLDGLDEVKSATILNLVRDNTRKAHRIALDVPRPGDTWPKAAPTSCTVSFDFGRLSIGVVCLLLNIVNLAFFLSKWFDSILTSAGKIAWMERYSRVNKEMQCIDDDTA